MKERQAPDQGNPKVTDALQKLETGLDQIFDDASYKKYLRSMSRFHDYSYANTLLIMQQYPEATRVAGYRKWQELRRQVTKGERGISILYPMFSKVEKLDDKTGEKKKDEILTGYGVGYVFDVSQTTGEPIPENPATARINQLEGEDEKADELADMTLEWVKRQGVTFAFEDIPINGYYQPHRKHIAVSENIDSLQQAKTLVHETAHHVAEHKGIENRSDRETAAEGSAFVVFDHFGLDSSSYSVGYVAHWAQDKDTFKRNLGQIQRVSTTIIQGVEGIAVEREAQRHEFYTGGSDVPERSEPRSVAVSESNQGRDAWDRVQHPLPGAGAV